MAIAYKSQGAGASTETSGAALSPLCPAVVDAGDILIAHVGWEGTADAPATPANWTLLDGPQIVQTTVARVWVFGKIADGTEDAAAVAFGAPAVTTQRAARVYSFSGRTAGTISELVQGFAYLSHATDPQMPTVTTTQTGALAVALVYQNDNNAFASPTGESGGDWVEAVAEYTVALTPGLSLGIETCTPTANPGTVSGGSMATTNDPCGVIAFEIRASAPQEVTPSPASLTLTTYAPTVSVTDNQNVTPSPASLVLTTYAPTVSVDPQSVEVIPSPASLVLTTYAPTVSVSAHVEVTPSPASLVLTTYAPTVSVSANVELVPSPASLALTTYAPTVVASNHIVVTPSPASLVVTTYAPTVSIGNNIEVTPSPASLLVTAYAPTVSVTAHIEVTPSPASLSLTTYAPTVSVSNHQEVIPTPASLVLTSYAPTVSIGGGSVEVTPSPASLLLTTYAPTVSISGGVVDEPRPPTIITGAGGGGRVIHRNDVSQWGMIRAREHRARQEADDRAILALLESFLTVMEG